MFAGHLTDLSSELEGVLADGTMGLHRDMAIGDLDSGHRLDGDLRSRRVLETRRTADSVNLSLGELVEYSLQSRAHQELRHAFRQGAETGSGAVIVVELEAAVGGPIRIASSAYGRTAKNNDGVEGRAVASGRTIVTAEPNFRGLAPTADGRGAVVDGGRDAAATRLGSGLGGKRKAARRVKEATATVWADDCVPGPNEDEATAVVAPVRRCRLHGSHQRPNEDGDGVGCGADDEEAPEEERSSLKKMQPLKFDPKVEPILDGSPKNPSFREIQHPHRSNHSRNRFDPISNLKSQTIPNQIEGEETRIF